MRIGCEKFDYVGVKIALIINNGYKDIECWMKDGRRQGSWGFDGAYAEGDEVIEKIELESGNVLYRVA